MEVVGLMPPAALRAGKRPPLPTELEAGWPPSRSELQLDKRKISSLMGTEQPLPTPTHTQTQTQP
jgi:hypothetical protein